MKAHFWNQRAQHRLLPRLKVRELLRASSQCMSKLLPSRNAMPGDANRSFLNFLSQAWPPFRAALVTCGFQLPAVGGKDWEYNKSLKTCRWSNLSSHTCTPQWIRNNREMKGSVLRDSVFQSELTFFLHHSHKTPLGRGEGCEEIKPYAHTRMFLHGVLQSWKTPESRHTKQSPGLEPRPRLRAWPGPRAAQELGSPPVSLVVNGFCITRYQACSSTPPPPRHPMYHPCHFLQAAAQARLQPSNLSV